MSIKIPPPLLQDMLRKLSDPPATRTPLSWGMAEDAWTPISETGRVRLEFQFQYLYREGGRICFSSALRTLSVKFFSQPRILLTPIFLLLLKNPLPTVGIKKVWLLSFVCLNSCFPPKLTAMAISRAERRRNLRYEKGKGEPDSTLLPKSGSFTSYTT